jgi:ATP-dependent DNA helicase RecQ
MEGIPGVGEKKRAEFGDVFARTIAEYLQTNARMAFE